MKTLLPLFLATVSLRAQTDALPPLHVTGNKLPADHRTTLPGSTQLEPDRWSAAAVPAATYQDLFASVAGAYAGNPVSGNFSLRGLNQDAVFASLGTGSNPLIAVTQDGVPLSPNALSFLPPLVGDLRSAEILRGAQPLIEGPNALGGAVRLLSQAPDFSLRGNALFELSEYATFRSVIAQNLILLPDELAMRVSYQHQETDGQATNLTLDDDEFAATRRDRYQTSLLWHPAANRDHRLLLSLSYDRSRGNPFGVTQRQGSFFDRRTELNTPSSYPADQWIASLQGTFSLPSDFILTSTSSLQRLDVGKSLDLDTSPWLNWFVRGFNDELRFTQDLTLARQHDGFQWSLGGYYEFSEYDTGYHGFGLFPFPSGSPFRNTLEETVRIAALYGRFDWEFRPSWHATGGLRGNYENRRTHASTQVARDPLLGSSEDHSQLDFLPQLGLAWQPDENTTLGIQGTRGYRGGGIAHAASVGISQPYDPEYSWELELYARLRPLDSLQLSASVFHSWMEDQQVPALPPGGFPSIDSLIANAGKSHRYGAELEARWQATPELSWHGALGWIHTEFDELYYQGADLSGTAFPNAPEWTASVGVDYRHPSGWFGSTLFSWSDTTFSSVERNFPASLETRKLLSAKLGYSWQHASLYLFGSNLLDDEYALLRTTGALFVSGAKIAPPRMLGIGCEWIW